MAIKIQRLMDVYWINGPYLISKWILQQRTGYWHYRPRATPQHWPTYLAKDGTFGVQAINLRQCLEKLSTMRFKNGIHKRIGVRRINLARLLII